MDDLECERVSRSHILEGRSQGYLVDAHVVENFIVSYDLSHSSIRCQGQSEWNRRGGVFEGKRDVVADVVGKCDEGSLKRIGQWCCECHERKIQLRFIKLDGVNALFDFDVDGLVPYNFVLQRLKLIIQLPDDVVLNGFDCRVYQD